MARWIRVFAVLTLAGYATPVLAQSFEGLDLSDSGSKKKKRRKKKKNETKEKEAPAESPAGAEAPAPSGGDTLAPLSPGNSTQRDMPPPPSGGFGLDLNAPPPPPTTRGKKDSKGGAMTFEAVDVSGKTADRQKLDAAIALFKGEKYDQAALAAYEIVKDPRYADQALEAHYLLAKALYRMGMYHSSLGEFSKILAAGPETKFFKTSLEWLFFISHKTTNESVILGQIARYSNFEFPEKFKSEFHYLLGRYYFVRGRALDRAEQRGEADKAFNEVKRNVLAIPPGDPFYARAKYLEGLAYFRDGSVSGSAANYARSVQDMKDVVRLTRPGGGKTPAQAKQDEDLRELAFMQLARTHYGLKQNRYAIYYYGKVERGNEQWLEALFEASWANYRIGQFEQALGNLITLSSPFFREEYFPEALILKAVIYFENCRYRESNAILEDFDRIYSPVMSELQQLTDKEQDASYYYNVLADIQKKDRQSQQKTSTDVILDKVLKLALSDKDFKQTNDSILELDQEVDSYATRPDAFKQSEMAKGLQDGLKAEREDLIKKAGYMAKGKLELELQALRKLLADGERIRFETTSKEKEFLEEQLRSGGRQEVVKRYKHSVAVADDQLYWPYEGEYWRDELGTYQYTLTKGCVDRDSVNPGGESGGM